MRSSRKQQITGVDWHAGPQSPVLGCGREEAESVQERPSITIVPLLLTIDTIQRVGGVLDVVYYSLWA